MQNWCKTQAQIYIDNVFCNDPILSNFSYTKLGIKKTVWTWKTCKKKWYRVGNRFSETSNEFLSSSIWQKLKYIQINPCKLARIWTSVYWVGAPLSNTIIIPVKSWWPFDKSRRWEIKDRSEMNVTLIPLSIMM